MKYNFDKNGIAKVNFSTFQSENKLIDITKIKVWPTLTKSGAHSNLKIWENGKIRLITGIEMLEIQGFKILDSMNNVSNFRLKFLAGNSISVYALKVHFKNINPKSIGVAFGGIDAVGEYFGRNKVVDYIENDKAVVKAHNIIYNTNYISRDFLKIKKMKGELLHFSPPCTNFSNQGKLSRLDEFGEKIIEVINNSKPKYISIENVIGYKKVMEDIKDNLIDYKIKIREIVPFNQSRRRLFLLGVRK